MLIMAVDLGKARTGIAACDNGFLAYPVTVISEKRKEVLLEKVSEEVKKADLIVVGLPKNMDGTEGFRADTVKAFVAILSEYTDIPIDLYDERMTTMQAYRFLGETKTFGKKRKGAVDTLSAEIILQNYLDRERN